MKLGDKLVFIQSVLNKLYPNPPIPLNHHSPFTLLCAVVLSAQTTDGKVNSATEKLFKVAPDAASMMKLPAEQVQEMIREVGLAPSKTKYLLGLSRMIIEQYNGKLPDTLEGLQTLPGVGRKTASVIMSQVYNVPAFAVDTHVHRLALRWGLSKDQKSPDRVQEDLCALFPQEEWNKLHLQFIYFGREYCTAKNHSNVECPICSGIHRGLGDEAADQSFTPKKRAKGIIYYGDRLTELSNTPELAAMSPEAAVEGTLSSEVVHTDVIEVKQPVKSKGARKVVRVETVLEAIAEEREVKAPRASKRLKSTPTTATKK